MNNLSHVPKDALAQLRRQIGALEESGREGAAVALGLAAIDAVLPWGGLPCGALHEIVGASGDGAALGFALMLLSRLGLPPHPPIASRWCPPSPRRGEGRGEGVINPSQSSPAHSSARPILWCRTHSAVAEHGALYGPGIAAAALNPRRMIFVTVGRNADALWVLEEGLRCDALSAVVGEGVAVDFTASRRLQLAARGRHALALLLPPVAAHSGPSAALTRWRVTSDVVRRPARNAVSWRVALHQCRGGRPQAWTVEANDAALRGAVAVPLADGSVEDASPRTIAG